MPQAGASTMRGRVLAVAEAGAAGLVAGEDGQRYRYGLTDLRSAAPLAGQEVDFRTDPDAGPSPESPVAREVYLILGPHPLPTVPATGGPQRDWAAFYLSPTGRVGRGDYWLYGVLVLFAVNLFLAWIPILGQIVSLAAGWSGLALAIRRCHDVDRSGWWIWLPLVSLLGAIVAGGLAALQDDTSAAIAIASLSGLVWFVTSLWVLFAILVRRGEPGDNRFGPPPLPVKP